MRKFFSETESDTLVFESEEKANILCNILKINKVQILPHIFFNIDSITLITPYNFNFGTSSKRKAVGSIYSEKQILRNLTHPTYRINKNHSSLLDLAYYIVYTLITMKKILKDQMFTARLTKEEKKLLEESAEKNGFHSVSQFILWLVKKYKSEKK